MASGRRDATMRRERARAQSVRGECNDLRVRPSVRVRPRSLDKERKNCGRERGYLPRSSGARGWQSQKRLGWRWGSTRGTTGSAEGRTGPSLPSVVPRMMQRSIIAWMTPEEAEGVTKAPEQEVFGASESILSSKTLKEGGSMSNPLLTAPGGA